MLAALRCGYAVLIILIGMPAIAQINVPEQVTLVQYEIEGQSIEELRKEMLAKGPHDLMGEKRFALVNWNVKWHWELQNGQPNYQSTKIEKSITLTAPHWSNEMDASPETINRWRAYYASLLQHENNHLQNAEQAIEAIEDLIRSAATATPPPNAQDTNNKIRAIISAAQRRDLEYDRETANGSSEGANLK